MKKMMFFTLTCVDQNQINAASKAIDDLFKKQVLFDTRIILRTSHVLAIQSNESNKEIIRAFAITVSKQSPTKIPLIYEEQAKDVIDLNTEHTESLEWTILDGKCEIIPIEGVNQTLESCEYNER